MKNPNLNLWEIIIMDYIFNKLFVNEPQKKENGIYYFGNENDGDYFDEDNFDIWRNGGFIRNWRYKGFLEHNASRHLAEEILNNNDYVIDLACGPGMGFIPSVKQLNPMFPCMATDANPFVLSEWKEYLDNSEKYNKLSFAQFSVFDIPLKSNSVQAYSSFIGVSSTRSGEEGHAAALSEIRRTLAQGGTFYTVENEWTDVGAILDLFDKMGQQPWNGFDGKHITWHDKFIHNGFEIVYEDPYYKSLRADDNELGEAAVKFGVDIGIKFTAFIVKKTKE